MYDFVRFHLVQWHFNTGTCWIFLVFFFWNRACSSLSLSLFFLLATWLVFYDCFLNRRGWRLCNMGKKTLDEHILKITKHICMFRMSIAWVLWCTFQANVRLSKNRKRKERISYYSRNLDNTLDISVHLFIFVLDFVYQIHYKCLHGCTNLRFITNLRCSVIIDF